MSTDSRLTSSIVLQCGLNHSSIQAMAIIYHHRILLETIQYSLSVKYTDLGGSLCYRSIVSHSTPNIICWICLSRINHIIDRSKSQKLNYGTNLISI